MAKIEVDGSFSVDMFRRVFSFCLHQWKRQPILIPSMMLSMLLATVCDAFVPVYAGHLIDALQLGLRGKDAAFHAILMIFVLAMILVTFRYLALYLLNHSSTRIMPWIIEGAFARVQKFSTSWHNSNFAGSTVRKITRGVWAYDLLADTVLLGFFPAFVMLVSVTILMVCRWPLMGGLVAAGIVIFVSVSAAFVLRFIVPAARKANAADSRIGAVLTDAISCSAAVKAFAGEAREEERLAETAAVFRKLTFNTWNRSLIAGSTQTTMTALLQTGMAVFAVWLWLNGKASTGDVAYVLATFTLIQGYLREMATHFRNLQKSVNEMSDVAAIAMLPVEVCDIPSARPLITKAGAIRFENVRFRYAAGEKDIYENFSIDIAPGELVGLVGASGSGKSTFVKLLQRLYDVQEGRISIDGQDIASVTQESLRRAISLVPQEPVLFHRSLAENIAYARVNATREEIIAAAKQARAHDFIAHLPEGYETQVGERGAKISGGERQRVAIARAVLSDARILVFDEATSSLDSVSEALLQQALETIMRGRTTLFIAHRLSTLKVADRILVFDNGRVVEMGSHLELMARAGQYRRLFDVQTDGLAAQ
ncbi:ATP-binding cassette subfamily B protein [Rhizomicrobium palustre]|uniref:ATP-binding cassette subfamily B protein n=1 Tax=Rhizomicrobium palustre TaxID=189966 RepID=A0A846N1Z5_9PROT|nr:ABC transporter ATP-binding protein [Rhizomicrobium palustre]NIK89519.1 ATP-binding cassette subfamily B protein [Rhizomicrobium palustre]